MITIYLCKLFLQIYYHFNVIEFIPSISWERTDKNGCLLLFLWFVIGYVKNIKGKTGIVFGFSFLIFTIGVFNE